MPAKTEQEQTQLDKSLIESVKADDVEHVKSLAEQGADLNTNDIDGKKVSDVAMDSKSDDMATYFQDMAGVTLDSNKKDKAEIVAQVYHKYKEIAEQRRACEQVRESQEIKATIARANIAHSTNYINNLFGDNDKPKAKPVTPTPPAPPIHTPAEDKKPKAKDTPEMAAEDKKFEDAIENAFGAKPTEMKDNFSNKIKQSFDMLTSGEEAKNPYLSSVEQSTQHALGVDSQKLTDKLMETINDNTKSVSDIDLAKINEKGPEKTTLGKSVEAVLGVKDKFNEYVSGLSMTPTESDNKTAEKPAENKPAEKQNNEKSSTFDLPEISLTKTLHDNAGGAINLTAPEINLTQNAQKTP